MVLRVLVVISCVFVLVSGNDKTSEAKDPMAEILKQQQFLLKNIENLMAVQHREILNKIDSAFLRISKDTNLTVGDLRGVKTILTDRCDVFAKPCPQGYLTSDYGCYKFALAPATMSEAKRQCIGQLVTVTSVGEQLALQSLMVMNNVSSDATFWTAGRKIDSKWWWGPSQAFSYTNWAARNPAVWDCMVLRGGDQRWETDYCNTKHSYICEV